MMLQGRDVGSLPVVRCPLWSKPRTDDEVPGSLGIALLEAGQTVLQVRMSRGMEERRPRHAR